MSLKCFDCLTCLVKLSKQFCYGNLHNKILREKLTKLLKYTCFLNEAHGRS